MHTRAQVHTHTHTLAIFFWLYLWYQEISGAFETTEMSKDFCHTGLATSFLSPELP